MNNKKKSSVVSSVPAVAFRSAEERIQKVGAVDGVEVYILKPRNPDSRALPRGPFKGMCRETGREFVYFATQVKRGDIWVDPVLNLHPETLKERMASREKQLALIPSEVLSAWQS